jgi:hypothetical protein
MCVWMSCTFFIQLHLVSSVWTLLFLEPSYLIKFWCQVFKCSSLKSSCLLKWSIFSITNMHYCRVEKRLLLDLSDTFRRVFHGLALRSQSCQRHLILRALLNLSKSFIPKPPHLLGLKHVYQLIRQRPPLALSGSSPFHRKLILNLSIL